MKTVNLGEAKARLSHYVREVRQGREPEIIIALDGVPAVRLLPLEAPAKRRLGIDAGRIVVSPDFDSVDSAIAELFLTDRSASE